ncbi:hypothetical protein [Arthrobacter sp. NPDC056727]|uniref:hypothetical protein n=1 Tax=Arthrobacter sp. NPDC056727 TaxID=3345927 RepID=UPI0036730CCA
MENTDNESYVKLNTLRISSDESASPSHAALPLLRLAKRIPDIGLSLMDTNDMDDPTADMEMSPAEAAGYLSGLVG